MDIGLPVALVVGIDHFVAKAITRALLEKDMAVIGVGEEAGDLQSDKRFELRSGVNEVEETVAYVFDLRQETAAWKKAATDGAKLEVLLIDQEKNTRTLENSLTALRVNWRIFEVYEVYGVEMDLECSWVGSLIVSAVLNKPLTLPKTKTVRPVAVEDVVEAALRACFLSGTGEERLVYAGAEMETEEVGKILRREAKMTKEEVQREGERIEIERETVEESWSKLRWVPTRAFQESIEETLQYFFTIADEVGRKKPSQIKTVEEAARKYVVEEVVEKKKLPYEVVAEEETRKTEKKEEKEKEKVEKKEEGKLAWVRPIILPTTPVEEEEEGELVEEEEAKPEEIPKQETVPKIMATKNIEPTKPVATVQVTNLVTTPKRRSGVSWGKVLLGVTVGMVIAGVAVMGWVAWQVWQVAVSVQTIEKSIQQQNWQKATATTTDALGKIRVMEGTLMDWGVNGEINQGMRVVDEGLVVVNKAIPVMSEGQQSLI
ncbi:hypothetical protein M1116_03660, partial [Patescibacteria group bacterium]|nr:hypothetical protein [Patescibacteria group bacterium]